MSYKDARLQIPPDMHRINEQMFRAETAEEVNAAYRELGIVEGEGPRLRFRPIMAKLFHGNIRGEF